MFDVNTTVPVISLTFSLVYIGLLKLEFETNSTEIILNRGSISTVRDELALLLILRAWMRTLLKTQRRVY